ncbi:MAG: plasmid pRiA4b ORF-3 family protein [Chloroflexi bacterium]|nr:plasmid pRiA4b ORF-3 family protein [Chloroflexota bacterium]
MSKQQPPPTIYRLNVTLKETEPAIWRRILVPSNITLHRLHLILQEIMGWTNSHLYRFEVGAKEYGESDPDNDFNELDFINSKRAKLVQLVTAKGNTFVYEYDFGDGWTHDLVVEDILEPVPGAIYPICLEGERACPPEDCGGPHGYSRLLGIIVNPEHEEYRETLTWLGGDFRPSLFSVEKVNRYLKPILPH